MTGRNGGYRDLVVWQRAMELVVEIYRCTKNFPKETIRAGSAYAPRCRLSPKQGKARYSHKERVQFLFRARGSLLELQTQITLAERLGYLSESDAIDLEGRSAMVGRLLHGLVTASSHLYRQSSPEGNS
jgi:four helix bundle protein